jgi:two-component system nitrogen regulation sensor histidine kinase NtrY
VPIQALVEGTQEIAAGNLDHRVAAVAGDELGFLIEQFNAMTGELRSSREAVTASRIELEGSNLQLEERRRYIEQLLENVPAAVISLDGGGVVTTMNRAAYRILGIDPSAPPAGRTAAEVFERRELGPLLHELDALLRGEGLPHVQEFELSVEGRVVHVSANLSPRRDAEGRVQGVLIVMEDLTPLIRAQRTTAWSEVARRIAHEIKNPLTPIQLSAQRILKKLQEKAEDFPRVVEESATAIVKEVGTLKDLVDEFSRFARMPAVKPVPNDANAIVEAALSLLEGIQPGIRFVRDLQPALPPAPIDADQMKRVLVNLIDNASAAMDGRGTITLRTRSVPEERIVRIEVVDDGPGIPPENKERLFVPYFSTKKRGTGLGLAIANRIVSDHNGYIRVEDNSPRGARFVIELPA